jgi:hypothetical protein
MSEEGTGLIGKPEDKSKPRRKRRNPSYSLEKFEPINIISTATTRATWYEVEIGFVSPKAAMAHVEKCKLEGVFRAVRQATEPQAATVIPQEPVWSIQKIDLASIKEKLSEEKKSDG